MGNFRSQPLTTKHSIFQEKKQLSFCATDMCGWRSWMEDATLIKSPFTQKQFSLFGVFDGHGGAQVAIFAERHFPRILEENVNFKEGKYQQALIESFLAVDDMLWTEQGKAQIIEIQKHMIQIQNAPNFLQQCAAGCTANVILITDEFIYCANVGDSRSVASTTQGAVQLSKDHKPDDPIEFQRIRNAGASVHNGRIDDNINLSRALGDLKYKQQLWKAPEQQIIVAVADVKKIPRDNTDFIIMGCDGIWQTKNAQQMVNWIKQKKQVHQNNLQLIVHQIMDQLLAKQQKNQSGQDNMSAILIYFNKKADLNNPQ